MEEINYEEENEQPDNHTSTVRILLSMRGDKLKGDNPCVKMNVLMALRIDPFTQFFTL